MQADFDRQDAQQEQQNGLTITKKNQAPGYLGTYRELGRSWAASCRGLGEVGLTLASSVLGVIQCSRLLISCMEEEYEIIRPESISTAQEDEYGRARRYRI